MTSSLINYIYTDSISRKSHIQRYWGYEYMNFWATQHTIKLSKEAEIKQFMGWKCRCSDDPGDRVLSAVPCRILTFNWTSEMHTMWEKSFWGVVSILREEEICSWMLEQKSQPGCEWLVLTLLKEIHWLVPRSAYSMSLFLLKPQGSDNEIPLVHFLIQASTRFQIFGATFVLRIQNSF